MNPRSQRWVSDNSYRQRHVGSAIAYNVWQYSQVTHDVEFLQFIGAELILEIARFWSSIATFNAERGRYEIRGVIGPDEFHEGYPGSPTPGLNSNAYTNVMAVWVLSRANDVLEVLPDVRRAELAERLGLSPEETARWDEISRRMFVPFHGDGIISQFEGYEQLAELDWDGYRRRYGNIQRLDLILEAENDSANRYKASKQADVLMLFYLFSADELRALFERLGYPFEQETIPRNVAYYDQRSSHGSTLSRVVHAWVLARSDRVRSMGYFTDALQSDVSDIQQGTTSEGIHLGAAPGRWRGGPAARRCPPQGIYFHWYEPSFYTGFAPGTQDPGRAHIELSRGQQVRFTLVLGEAELDAYLDDLALRRRMYQELIDAGVIKLTTNNEYERFAAALDQAGVATAIAERAGLGPDAYRQESVEIMRALNPDRVFAIRMPFGPLADAWHGLLARLGAAPSPAARLDAANALLPGRIALAALDAELGAALDAAARAAAAGPPDAAFRQQAERFLDRATQGRYRVRNGAVGAVELTAIYPAGTAEATTTYKGEKLPDFGVTGIWPLIPRTQGRGLVGMVDYLSPNPGYGYITMLPYQHAGGIAYNAFHNAGVRCQLNSTPFLPAAWRRAASERGGGKPYNNLWIVSRGPTSHGCTRLGSGHMSELRNSLPADSKVLQDVATYRNRAQCHDVFDVDGDGRAEVMGVQYYLAYRSNGHTPAATYVTNRREPFYRWLYGDNVALGAIGETTLKEVPVCRFIGARKAEEAETLTDMPLYEAPWARESIQFYTLTPASFDSPRGYEFNRELRKVGGGHSTDRAKLFLK